MPMLFRKWCHLWCSIDRIMTPDSL